MMIKHVNNEKLAGKDEMDDEPLDLFFFISFLYIQSSRAASVCLSCFVMSSVNCFVTKHSLLNTSQTKALNLGVFHPNW